MRHETYNTHEERLHAIHLTALSALAGCALLLSLPAIAGAPHPAQETEREDSLELRVYFQQGRSILVPSFRDNDLRLTQFASQMRRRLSDTTVRLQDIVIFTGASPEGAVSFNRRLSIDRGLAIRGYLQNALELPDSVFVMQPVGEDWERMAEMVERYRVPSWMKVLEIIDTHPARDGFSDEGVLEERKRLIRAIDGGRTWKYLLDNIFPELRGGDNYIACHFAPKNPETRTIVVESHTSSRDTLYIYSRDTVWMAPSVPVYAPYTGEGSYRDDGPYARRRHPRDTTGRRRYQFAVKTNLLMDLGTALNVELEFPVGKRWSLMAEHWFPWWTFWYDGVSYTMQVLRSSLECRCWFGDRSRRPVLSGLFLGAYAGAALFDVEWRSEGIQGETFIDAGLSFGYSFNIGRNWRLETSLSAGYFRFDGRTYRHDDYWMLRIWQEDRTISWIGPTKLKCSISWLIPPQRRNKGIKEGGR